MARIAGVDLPKNKRMEYALTSIFGIGVKTSREILTRAKISHDLLSDQTSEDDLAKIRELLEREYRVEGDLRRDVSLNIKRLMDLGCYRGLRHRKGLPVRGQRTHTNARTRKGPRSGSVKRK